MSFSKQIKKDLANQWSASHHCRVAEVVAMISMLGEVQRISKEEKYLQIAIENAMVARKCFTFLKKAFNIRVEISLQGQTHLIKVQDVEIGSFSQIVKKTCCKRAFIRGAFLASGSISNPEKGYHFEIVTPTKHKAEQLQCIMNSFELEAKIIPRKSTYVVYLKESTQIVDVLNVMEAHIALMELENVRILKEVRNHVNRKVNCEAANINKTVAASLKQREDILYLREQMGFNKLPEGLQEMAMIRMDYPDASLKELGELMNPPIGKSGVNHRLRKLSLLAEEIRDR